MDLGDGGLRTYALLFNSYLEAIRALRKLRKRGVYLEYCVVVVRTEHHNKVKDYLSRQRDDALPRPRLLMVL